MHTAQHTERGFTLIETFVAVTLLAIAVAGPMTIANKSVHTARISKQRVTATYLAQEAIEYVRKVRDTNFLRGNSWLNGLQNCTNPAGNKWCTVDTYNESVNHCGGNCDPLQRNGVGYYNQQSGPQTPYTRIFSIENIEPSDPSEVKVTVEVSWEANGRTYTEVVHDNMTNWW